MAKRQSTVPYSSLAQEIVLESMARLEFLRTVNLDLTDKQSNQQLTEWAVAIDKLIEKHNLSHT